MRVLLVLLPLLYLSKFSRVLNALDKLSLAEINSFEFSSTQFCLFVLGFGVCGSGETFLDLEYLECPVTCLGILGFCFELLLLLNVVACSVGTRTVFLLVLLTYFVCPKFSPLL